MEEELNFTHMVRLYKSVLHLLNFTFSSITYIAYVDLGGLGVTCSTRDPRFAGSNPAEVDKFFQDVKILGGTSSPGSRVSDFRLVKESQA